MEMLHVVKKLVLCLSYRLNLLALTMHVCLLQEAHSPFKFIFVPKIYRHLTRKRVLTMEWVVGENPNDLLAVSTRSSISDGSQYSEEQQLEAKKRLLDMVCILKFQTLNLFGVCLPEYY